MKAFISEGCTYITLVKEQGDPKFHGLRYAKGEHALLHFVAKWLNARGFDVIKKRAQLDGHMIGDQFQPYLRTRKPRAGLPHVMLWSGFYALRGANQDWNHGQVSLLVETDCYERGQDTEALIANLCRIYPADMTLGGEPHLHHLQLMETYA
jgi:hypothetical protein